MAEKRNRRSDGVSEFWHRGICLCSLSWPRQRQIPRLPGANPTHSRGDSHGWLVLEINPTRVGQLQRQIPRAPEAYPTQDGSGGGSHGPQMRSVK